MNLPGIVNNKPNILKEGMKTLTQYSNRINFNFISS